MLFENIRLAFSTIRRNKVRSLLTMLGVIIAVWAVVMVVSIGNGIKAQVSDEIGELGSRLITITPGDTITRNDNGGIESFNPAGALTSTTFTLEDVEDIKLIEGVSAAAPQMIVSGTVTVDDKTVESAFISATDEDYPEALNQKVQHGGFFSNENTDKNLVIIGDDINNEYFSGKNPIGSTLEIRDDTYIVQGVMEESKFGAGFGADLNRIILINIDNGKKYANDQVVIQEIDVLVEENADIDQVIELVADELRENQGGEENFTIIKQEDILSLTDSIFTLLTSGVGLIAGVSIIVGGIGIMNIMLVSVTERTREIGLRKAIGAYPSQILQQFLIESIVLSVFGGLIGLILAWISGILVKANSELEPTISLTVILVTLFGSAIIGVASGMWPALKAARKKPIESLRYE